LIYTFFCSSFFPVLPINLSKKSSHPPHSNIIFPSSSSFYCLPPSSNLRPSKSKTNTSKSNFSSLIKPSCFFFRNPLLIRYLYSSFSLSLPLSTVFGFCFFNRFTFLRFSLLTSLHQPPQTTLKLLWKSDQKNAGP